MFKEKAAKLLKSNSELINASDLSEFSIEELEKTGIHPAFIKYLWAEKIPVSNGENDGQFLFSKNEINIGLKKAAVFNLNFLFNPVFLLKKILFVKDKPINEESFEDLKNRVYYFRYYIDILIKLYKSDKLNSESYDETMSKIQKKLFSVNYNSLITDGVDALNHFFNHGEHYSGLDPECMKLFLLSRDLKDSFDKLIPHYNGKDQLSIWKIKDVLTGSEESVFDARFDITREISHGRLNHNLQHSLPSKLMFKRLKHPKRVPEYRKLECKTTINRLKLQLLLKMKKKRRASKPKIQQPGLQTRNQKWRQFLWKS